MKKTSFFIALCVLCLALGGCTLAVPSGSDPASSDCVAGVFVNVKHVDAQDSLPFGNARTDAQGRFYATKQESDAGGRLEYVFAGAQGSGIFRYQAADGSGVFTHSGEPYFLTDLKFGHHISDDKNETNLEATIVITPGFAGEVFVAPISIDAENDLYFYPDAESFAVNGTMQDFKKTLSYENTVAADENKEAKLMNIILNVHVANPTKSLTLTQMNAENEVVSSVCYEAQALPEELALPRETRYLIVKDIKTAPDGTEETQRTILTSLDIAYSIYYEKENACLPSNISLIWAE